MKIGVLLFTTSLSQEGQRLKQLWPQLQKGYDPAKVDFQVYDNAEKDISVISAGYGVQNLPTVVFLNVQGSAFNVLDSIDPADGLTDDQIRTILLEKYNQSGNLGSYSMTVFSKKSNWYWYAVALVVLVALAITSKKLKWY